MILYHYTSRRCLEAIRSEGITRGEVPLSDTRVLRAVNLTTDPSPIGHGLDAAGRVVTPEEALMFATRFGWRVRAGAVFENKREARITVKLRSSDPLLRQWLPWARKRLDPAYLARLVDAAGGGMRAAKTWWLYWGPIPPSAFSAIDLLEPVGTEAEETGLA